MRSMKAFRLATTLVILNACAEPPRRSADEGPISKPAAPVAVTLDARRIDDDRSQVTFTATPKQDAVTLEMRLEPRGGATLVSGPTLIQFGATPAGVRREVVAEVRGQGTLGALVFGHTSITTGTSTRSKSINVALGRPPASPAGPTIRNVTLPDGTRVAETRP